LKPFGKKAPHFREAFCEPNEMVSLENIIIVVGKQVFQSIRYNGMVIYNNYLNHFSNQLAY